MYLQTTTAIIGKTRVGGGVSADNYNGAITTFGWYHGAPAELKVIN
jgi:hypothetical protein